MLIHLHFIYATYLKKNSDTGKIYVGRTSGLKTTINLASAIQIVEKRDKYHHRNKDGYEKATIDQFSTDKAAIRGREHQLIEKFKAEGKSGNVYNGISIRNKKRNLYIAEALRIFGDAAIIAGVWYLVQVL